MSDLVVYSLIRAPIAYIGKLESVTADSVVLSRVLVLHQQPNARGEDTEQVTIGNLPYASRESKVTFCKEATPGILVENIDEDLSQHYNTEIVSAYSKLRIIA